MGKFKSTDKLGTIVAELPSAAKIFKTFHIDYCCGGQRQLVAAANEKGIDEAEVLQALNKAFDERAAHSDEDVDWRNVPYTDLIDHIVDTHHAYLNSTLPELGELTNTILRVHGANHGELRRVHRLFNTLKMDLEEHLITEEETLFPLIREYANTGDKTKLEDALKVIDQIESEHEGAGDILKELRQMSSDYDIPADACPTFERTYQMLEELEGDLFSHIHLENNVLHPQLRAKLKK